MDYKQYEPETLKKVHRVDLELLEVLVDLCNRHNIPCFAVYGTILGALRHKSFIPWDDDVDVGVMRKDYDRLIKLIREELSDKYNVVNPLIDNNYACTVTHFEKKGTRFVTSYNLNLDREFGICIDIFPFDNVADNPAAAKHQANKAWIWGRLLWLSGRAQVALPFEGVKATLARAVCYIIHYVLKIFHIKPSWLYKHFVKAASKYNDKETKYITCFDDQYSLKHKYTVEDIFPLREVPFEHFSVKIPNQSEKILTLTYGDYMTLPPVEQRRNHCPAILDFGDGNVV